MFVYPKKYDVIVIGAGHAGVEAALATSRIGCATLLLTMNPDSLGQMSCNPAIGGLGKGHLVREIDALGGEMGLNTDLTGIHFRMLNTKKGPAVRSLRAQCDKRLYQSRLKWVCERQESLDVKLGQAISLSVHDGTVTGVDTSIKVRFLGKAVVVTTGTFLQGLMHIGTSRSEGGRSGESPAVMMSNSLRRLGLELGRLKTGTPPRVQKRTIDFGRAAEQPGDTPPEYFSHRTGRMFHVEHRHSNADARNDRSYYPAGSALERNKGQVSCHLTFTTAKTAQIVRENLYKSPLYTGLITGVGPRYCPSIEDKIVRFREKEHHQVFLEPEGLTTDEVYLNGVSTSLPYDVQLEVVRSIPSCENAELIRPAYAVEYDYVFPTQIHPTLETKCCKNLFLAGQINGTSGYEEAAAQGLIAGINAAMSVIGKSPLVLRRDQAYIGVLVDDLVTKGTAEPYRMFTSRSEFRLLLRHDNADQRLTEIGKNFGLVSDADYKAFRKKNAAFHEELNRLRTVRHGNQSLEQLLRRPDVTYEALPDCDRSLPKEVARQVEISIKYSGYVDRQAKENEWLASLDSRPLFLVTDYAQIRNLRLEARQKLNQIRPRTLGQASRIPGVSPADISALAVWLRRHTVKGSIEVLSPNSCGHTGEEA